MGDSPVAAGREVLHSA